MTSHPSLRPAALAVAVAVGVVVLGGCGASVGASGTSASSSASSSPSASPSTTDAPTTTTTIDPATLPQTEERPVAGGEAFDHRARALWDAVVADDPSVAVEAFFPLAAYQQVKAIKDPASDWHGRLIGELKADVHALHTKLGATATSATFDGLTVPDQAVWVTPGQEHNKLPYWRVYGSTLDYSVDGVARTLPVGSLISWRGQWYVVHLGAIR